MKQTSVLIAGAGPVGMTLAFELAFRGIPCVVVEKNLTTTSYPKMDITNGRSMELFRRIGLADRLREVAVPQDHPFDVSWITSLSGHELHRFRYPSAKEQRRIFQEQNDGSKPLEPAMRVSQVEVERALRKALEKEPLVDLRYGTAFEDLDEDDNGVTATVRSSEGAVEHVCCQFLIGCDGGSSRVRSRLNIKLSGRPAVMQRFMTHFRSTRLDLLQRWGIAWHYQSMHGTLIAQNDRDIWTLHSRFPQGAGPDGATGSALLERFAGTAFDHEILITNPWTPHLVVADSYGAGRVLLAGDAAHQYIPTGGYGMNTGIGDACDLGWKLAALLKGFGGKGLILSYEQERRPVGLRNCDASRRHNATRMEISKLFDAKLFREGADGDSSRRWAASEISKIGNHENESLGIEFGYWYRNSPIVVRDADDDLPSDDPVTYCPTTVPGARLPSVYLKDNKPLFDKLGAWFTIINFGDNDASAFVEAASQFRLPLKVLDLDEPAVSSVYGEQMMLVRPDQHIAWRGSSPTDRRSAATVLSRVLGRA
jgi:2-polyprenyl-6-methoxyphenol hydroxylase-like FAD-dependent oxidoreductase